MNELIKLLVEHGHDIFMHHTKDLIGVLNPDGRIIHANDWLSRLQSYIEGEETGLLNYLLDSECHLDFQNAMETALEDQATKQTTLIFHDHDTKLTLSYNCWFIPVGEDQVLFYADAIPPFKQAASDDYLKLVDELARKKKELDNINSELTRRAQELDHKKSDIEKKAHVDELTRLPNRLSILSFFEQQIKIARRYENDMSLFILNFDNFKEVNTNFGYEAGDHLLKHGVEILKQIMRNSDFLGRYASDEFIGILPETDQNAAMVLTNRIRAQMEASDFILEDKTRLNFTVSIGVAQFDPNLDKSDVLLWRRYSLLWRADNALLQAKDMGGNRVVVWHKEMGEEKPDKD